MTLRRFRTVTTLLAGLAVASAIFAGGISPTPSSAAPTNATEANSVQLTFGTHYDRNSTTLKAADGTYWMYFARSVEPCDRATGGCNADGSQYNIFYMNSSDPATFSNPVQLSDRTGLSQFFYGRTIAATQDSTGTIWVFWASGGNGGPLYYYTKEPNQPWSARGELDDELYFNVEAAARGNELWMFYEDATGTGVFSRQYSYDSGTWSSPTPVASGMSIPKAYVDGNTFYLTMAKTDTWPDVGDYVTSSTDGVNWTEPMLAVPAHDGITNWDPTIVKKGNRFSVFSAPDTGDGSQHIAWTQSSNKGRSWPGTNQALTTASYGTTSWWDYWPEAMVVGGDIYLTYTSERNADATGAGPAHIWLMRVPDRYNP